MRVIAGKAKGRRLKAPKDASITRPATDLVREAIFSILENRVSDWTEVLDLFSGSGALGIEALSRGAKWVDFVEREPRCCDIIKQNLTRTGFIDQASVHCCDVARAIDFLNKEYNIVIMDPPYTNPSIGRLITKLASSSLIGKETTVVVTHATRLPLDNAYTNLRQVKEHRHGDTCIAIYQKEDQP
jgi:16S rRNA (guanine966-N2)-methyltransferase